MANVNQNDGNMAEIQPPNIARDWTGLQQGRRGRSRKYRSR